ncbi:MAG: dimethylhistidine N-methyltransferase [Frankiales bacterium]|nr:dimethylhistidine N-methyltransferase [Frankiales bacterium]
MSHWSVEERTAIDPGRLAADIRQALSQRPVSIPPKWFYDEKGSQLFEAITELPEYYPTRTEEAILLAHVAELPLVDTLVELGAGYSRKTRLLLEALTRGGRELLFVPLDVSPRPLRDAAERITADFPTVTVRGVVADFDDELAPLPGEPGSRMVAFLGSTIGNLTPVPRAAFLERLHRATDPGDWFLLGADLVKDPDRLVRAYDDSAGVTAAFNKNMLQVLARELDADVDPDDFEHVARYDPDLDRIEMWLRARHDVVVRLHALDLVWRIAQGEEILTETSAKFRLEGLRTELAAAGFAVATSWTDDAGDFSLTLARRT